METRIAGTPFSRAQSRCSWCVSSTVATSTSGTRRPPPTSSSTPRMSPIVRKRPAVLPTTSCSSPLMRPAATSWFCVRSASMICDTVSPYDCSRSWSSVTCTSRTRPPEMSIDATPSTVSSCGRSRSSIQARSDTRSRVSEENATS
jgi:hypothetical protein